MQFSEDDLRRALERKDPGPEFTDRVMARLKEKESARGATRSWFARLRFSPAVVAATLAVMLLLCAWIGYESYQRHQEQAQVEKIRREAEERKAEQQARLALRIASQKLNHVFQTVSIEPQQDEKIRRQRL